MHTRTVRNISEGELSIPGIGLVQPGATVKVPEDFNNPNFKDVKEDAASDSDSGSRSEQRRKAASKS